MRRGDPELRLEEACIVISRTPEMEEMEKMLVDRVLLVTILPGVENPPRRVTIRNVIDTIMSKCGIEDGISCKLSSPPAHYLFRFNRPEDCTAALNQSMQMEVNGCTIKFARWKRSYRGEEALLPFSTVVSLDGFPEDGYERGFVQKIVNELGGEFIEHLTPVDLRCVKLKAWIRNPWKLPKKLRLEVPEPFRFTIPDDDDELGIEQSFEVPGTALSRCTFILMLLCTFMRLSIHIHC